MLPSLNLGLFDTVDIELPPFTKPGTLSKVGLAAPDIDTHRGGNSFTPSDSGPCKTSKKADSFEPARLRCLALPMAVDPLSISKRLGGSGGVAGESRAAAGVGVGISVSMCLLVRADLKAHSYGNLSLHSGLAEHSSTSRFRVRFQEACGLTGVMRLRRGRRPEAVEETLEVPSTQSLTLPELQFSRGQW